YLPNSILRFPKPAQFIPMLQEAGFQRVEHHAFTFGVCRLYVATK
ncbi:MAG: class I SAM-dependent methyltransferase, partial [Bacteroidales bacterium]|nr:class I SAM-dependent methyltransferase [Bacteroidales bacterium]